ncbi:MAG TPA: ZIP family metal transporter [Actinomycetota bacterium]|nr:ZIP family metal transporter [Actinomycetota bacterium]
MSTAETRSRVPVWLGAIAPVLLVAALLLVFVSLDPLGGLRPVPPVETVAFERVKLEPGSIEMQIRNDGPDPVTFAQVLVNDAYWTFTIGNETLDRLESTLVRIPYPWDEGLPLNIALVTSSGVTIEHEIEAAAETPQLDGKTLWIYASLGVYIGVIPIAVGLLWFSALKRASKRWLGFFLAFTVGLLTFLLVDTVDEGLELASETGAALNGPSLFAIGALVAVVGLFVLEHTLERRRDKGVAGLMLAYFIAAGIGLHNLGEGLAVGAALAAGEFALGTFLVVGFALHNTTEGLAIVAPLGTEDARPGLWHFVGLGALAGVPTIAGALLGGSVFSPAWATLAFGVAAGAIAQVVWTITRALPAQGRLTTAYGGAGFLVGLVVMYATGLLT